MKYLLVIMTIEGDNPPISQVIIAAIINIAIVPAQIFGYAYLISYATKLAWN